MIKLFKINDDDDNETDEWERDFLHDVIYDINSDYWDGPSDID